MSGDHNQYQADQFPDATKMIDCATCGYPLTEEERTGLVGINGKMHKPWVGLTDDDIKPLCDEWRIMFGSWAHDFARAIEAKLKEKNAYGWQSVDSPTEYLDDLRGGADD